MFIIQDFEQFSYDQFMTPYFSYPTNYQDLVNGVSGVNGATVPSINEKVFFINQSRTKQLKSIRV